MHRERRLARHPAVFAAFLALGCGPTGAGSPPPPPESPTQHAPSPERPASRIARPGCADLPKYAEPTRPHDPSRNPFREAHERACASAAWDSGPAKAEPPPGFHRLSLSADPEDSSADPEISHPYLEPEPDRVAAWELTHEPDAAPEFYHAFAEVIRHRAPPARPKSLFRHVVTTFHGQEVPEDAEDEQIYNWFNYLSFRTDPRGRRIVEWGIIAKGCERWEVYELFVEDGEHIWHLRISIEPTAPEATLADWLARFFDAPLGSPLPPERRSLRNDRMSR